MLKRSDKHKLLLLIDKCSSSYCSSSSSNSSSSEMLQCLASSPTQVLHEHAHSYISVCTVVAKRESYHCAMTLCQVHELCTKDGYYYTAAAVVCTVASAVCSYIYLLLAVVRCSHALLLPAVSCCSVLMYTLHFALLMCVLS
jgi:hypothetical protein